MTTLFSHYSSNQQCLRACFDTFTIDLIEIELKNQGQAPGMGEIGIGRQ
jgi:hypothetical protein